MSRQQSSTPDEPEVPKKTGLHKRLKPWSLWKRTVGPGGWYRVGHYVSRKAAEAASAAGYRQRYLPGSFQVMHEDEGKPD